MYKAVFLDIDGTLLTSDHTLSPATRKIIRKLDEKGILIVLVTARPPTGVAFLYEELGITHNPSVCFNGGCIMRGNERLFEAIIPAGTVHTLLQETGAFPVNISLYQGQDWYTNAIDAWVTQEQAITDAAVEAVDVIRLVRRWQETDAGPNKVLLMGEPTAINQLEDHLNRIALPELNIYKSKPTYLEITHADAAKPTAIQYILNRYQIRREEIIAIGDNYNDREMIEMAGLGIAMGNAPEVVKAAADYVTDTNDNDGVPKALERFLP
jgi:Cof subfamily protein (haloacid dehalogenase superfamily)